MDYQRVTETGLTILSTLHASALSAPFMHERSTIGSTYQTVMLLPVRPIDHGTHKHYSIENVL